jgi:hypothetical protein
VDVRHDVVPQLLLLLGGQIVVDIVHMLLHLGNLLGRDLGGEPELALRLGQRDPQLAPSGELDCGDMSE